MRAEFIDTINNISVQEWNAVFPNVLEGYYFSKTLDESGVDQFTFCYIVVYEGEKIVGAAPCFFVNYQRRLKTTF